MTLKRKISGLLAFAVAMAVLLALLKALNWMPVAIQGGAVKSYASIEEVESALNIRPVYTPTFFPERLSWPPTLILAQSRPFEAVVMEFGGPGSEEVNLLISQSSNRDFLPDENIRMVEVREKAPYDLKGRSAVLEAGACREETACSRVSWDEGGYRINVVMRAPPLTAIDIAESMIR